MKNVLACAAVLTASGIAAAQSSLTIFGITGVAVSRGTGSLADRTQLISGGNSATRFGFRGTEELGQGLTASFWLEAAIANDTGVGGASNTNNQVNGAPTVVLAGGQGFTFARRSTLSLAGGMGELRLGRDYSVQYSNFEFDPFGNNGVGQSQAYVGLSPLRGPASDRVSNAILYVTPSGLGGFYARIQYYLGENPSNAGPSRDDGTGGGMRAGWRGGPLHVSASYVQTRYAQTASAGDLSQSNISARYDAGRFAVMGVYVADRLERAAGLRGRGAQLGGIVRTGTGEFRAQLSNYSTDAAGKPETRKLSLGYVHRLSKRTNVFAAMARVRNSGGAATALNGSITAPNQASSGYDFGISHSF